MTWLHCAARRAGVSPAKRQAVVTFSKEGVRSASLATAEGALLRKESRRPACDPPVDGNFHIIKANRQRKNAAQPGNRRRVRSAARRAGVSPATRQSTVTFTKSKPIAKGKTQRSLESRRLACETPVDGNFTQSRPRSAAGQPPKALCSAKSAGVSPATRQSSETPFEPPVRRYYLHKKIRGCANRHSLYVVAQVGAMAGLRLGRF